MNEFDLIGPQFISFYIPVVLGTILGAVATRYALKITGGEYQDIELSAYDAAYLSGGDQRVVDAAAAKLLHSRGSGQIPNAFPCGCVPEPIRRKPRPTLRRPFLRVGVPPCRSTAGREIWKESVPLSSGAEILL